jgi:ABC-type transport system involved in multi-copper enzyme maturation permease subunit
MTTLRLVLRQHRWTLGFAVLLALVLGAGALVAWAALAGISTPAHCIEDRFLTPIPPECVGTEEFLRTNEDIAGKVMAAMAVLPLLTGILVGVPLVGSEIETRTATIAWSLGPSRRRWLAVRLAILGVVLAGALVLPAFAADLLAAVRPPQYDMSTATLIDYGLRGPLVVMRGLASFGIGVVAGLVLGRVLPALLVAVVTAVLLWNGLGSLQSYGWPPEETFTPREGEFFVQTGNVIGGIEPQGERPDEPMAVEGIPGEKLGFIATREAAILAGLTVVLLGGSLLAIERRRPG